MPKGVHPTHQQRGEQTQNDLLDAARALLRERSVDAVSVRAISEAAGYTTGAFYKRFKSKEALLDLLYDRFAEEVATRVEMFRELRAEPTVLIETYLAALIELYDDQGQLVASLIEAARDRPDYRDRARELILSGADALEHAWRSSGHDTPTGEAFEFACVQVHAVLDHRALYGGRLPTRDAIANPTLMTYLAASMHSILR